MIKIHSWKAFTRDCRPRWLLNELEIPFEAVPVDLSKGEHRKPDYLRKNPSGRIPYYESAELSFCESGAMLLYLADQYPEKQLAPDVKSPLRVPYYQWLFYGASSLDRPAIDLFINGVRRPEAPGAAEAFERANKHFDDTVRFLDFSLDGKKYLLGTQFTAADVMVGSTLNWANQAKALERHPTLKRYMDELQKRPAYRKTFTE